MRVISGTAKGRKLVAPSSKLVRPALDKIKEAIFDILYNVEGAAVLDLFAGSGSVGIEALSRGASEAVFVDNFAPSITAIYKNLENLKLDDRARVMKSPVAAAIKRLGKQGKAFDLIFVDPPYEKNLVNPTLGLLAESPLVSEESVIVVEHHPKEPITAPRGLVLTDSRKYGQTCITFLALASSVERLTSCVKI